MFRTIGIGLAVASISLVQAAEAQTSMPKNVCIYADRAYSKGAVMCLGPRLSLECVDGVTWKKTEPGGSGAGDLVVVCRDAPFINLDNAKK
jgi:hypothetical protein